MIIGPGETKTLKDHGTRMKAVDLTAKLAGAYPRSEDRQEHQHRHLHLEITEPSEVTRFKLLHGRAPTERKLKELMRPDRTPEEED